MTQNLHFLKSTQLFVIWQLYCVLIVIAFVYVSLPSERWNDNLSVSNSVLFLSGIAKKFFVNKMISHINKYTTNFLLLFMNELSIQHLDTSFFIVFFLTYTHIFFINMAKTKCEYFVGLKKRQNKKV